MNHEQFKYWQYQLVTESKQLCKLKRFCELKAIADEEPFKVVELKLGNRYSVTLSGDFDSQIIVKVLNALEGRS